MTFHWRTFLALAGMALTCLTVVEGARQTTPQTGRARPRAPRAVQKPPAAPHTTAMTSDQAFKNVQVLKGIPVDDFMGTMGFITAALGADCATCHLAAGTDKVDWAADTPRKRRARGMMEMVMTLNRTKFGGRQVVTCWSCHRGRDRPLTTPALEAVYGMPPAESDDLIVTVPGQQPTASQILDKYIQALGGAERLAGLTSYVAKGTNAGFGGFGGAGRVQIFAKAPDQRTLLIEYTDAPGRGDTTRSFNGKTGWLRTPLTVIGEYELSGGELDGARLDALLSFPGSIKQTLSNLRVGPPTGISDLPAPSSQTSVQGLGMIGQDRDVQVVQGTGPRGILVTLFFDAQSGLLLRTLRYGNSPIGRVPTQIDYADYRDVGGIKFPFRVAYAWLDGRDAIQLNEIQTNVPIDAARFGRPAPLK